MGEPLGTKDRVLRPRKKRERSQTFLLTKDKSSVHEDGNWADCLITMEEAEFINYVVSHHNRLSSVDVDLMRKRRQEYLDMADKVLKEIEKYITSLTDYQKEEELLDGVQKTCKQRIYTRFNNFIQDMVDDYCAIVTKDIIELGKS
ncbi:RasGEF [Acrasis kona]|uniref:RasGEF n=1 Tax=Acrasis kona TaxID=1008807 RepID=A0AAW2Z0D5_9EUKA